MVDNYFLERVEGVTSRLNAVARKISAERRPIKIRDAAWPPEVQQEIEAFRVMVARSPWLNV